MAEDTGRNPVHTTRTQERINLTRRLNKQIIIGKESNIGKTTK
jgi:hypothetical protein